LAYRFPSNGRFHGVLNVRYVDAIPRRFAAIHDELQVRLADHPKQPEIGNAGDGPHYVHDLIAFRLQRLQIVPIDLHRKLPFHAADRFLHVVRDGLREVPQRAGNFLKLPIHGANQLFLFWRNTERHWSLGLRSTKYSVLKNPVVSVPSSGRPTCDTTCVTSGNDAKISRAWFITRSPSEGPVLGASVPRAQIAPSSRCGRNSEPMIPLHAR